MIGVSVAPLELFLPPEPRPVYMVEEPPPSGDLGLRWPVVESEPELPPEERWYQTEKGVLAVVSAAALAILTIWKREKIVGWTKSKEKEA